jgi:hypothetical protein
MVVAAIDALPVVETNHMAAGAVIHIPLPAIEERPQTRARLDCQTCGGHAFVIHQRVWKRIRDPHLARVEGVRYRCKRCGRVARRYPAGAGDGRQSDAVREMSVLLYCIGLTYDTSSLALWGLGCGVSSTTVRHNVESLRVRTPSAGELSRLHLECHAGGRLSGPDGGLTLRVDGNAQARSLTVMVDPGSGASDLRWRIDRCTRSVIGRSSELVPPGSA